MSQGLVERQNLEDIADAIRSKNGSSDTYTPAEMAQAISGIHTADEVVLMQKTVNANGQYNASDDSADGYSGVRVNVPNSYSASDEGKVVSNGNLVAQTTKQITANGTHDTTTNNSVSVDVPNSYAASDNGKVVVNQELVAQTSKNINANGTHDTTANNSVVVDVPNSYTAADEGKVVSDGALVGQTSRNVTANGTYDTTENNQIVVNVSGGGGGDSNVTVSTESPTALDGHIGDIWVKYYKIISDLDITGQRTYKISILSALRGTSSLNYAGASEIDIIFDDGNGNEVSMRGMNDFSYIASNGSGNNAFDNDNTTYWEGRPVNRTNPLTMSMTATIPAEYKFKRLSVMQRSSGSYTSDVWEEFTLSLNENTPFIHKENLSTNDWAGANNYTYFIKERNVEIATTYIKIGETEETAEWVEPASIEVSINE